MPLARTSTSVGKNRHFQGRKNYPRGRKKKFIRKRGYKKRKRSYAPTQRIIKAHKFAGHDDMSLFGSVYGASESSDPVEWYVFSPLMLNRQGMNNPSDTDSQSNKVFARNSRAEFQVIPSKRYIEGFQMRVVAGWFKGDDNVGTQGLTKSIMKSVYPDIQTRLQTKDNAATDDFKFSYERKYTFTPRQIYDEDTEEGDHMGADRTLVALWTPQTIRVNMKHFKTFTYEGADGDSLNGWNPIICLQCKPLKNGTAFTRPTLPAQADAGSAPGPRIHSSMVTYFSDIH